jgi:hypothetical protein
MGMLKKSSAPEIEVTATEAIRRRVWARWKKTHLARTCTDLNIPLPTLEAFAQGTGQLPEADLHKLVKEFYHNARLDFAADKLIDTSPPA